MWLDFEARNRIVLQGAADGGLDPVDNLDLQNELAAFYGGACKALPPLCTDYVGPVEIRRAPQKGRGLFLIKDVEPGELLLVCNPLALILPEKHDQNRTGALNDRLTSQWRRSHSVGLEDFVSSLANLREISSYQLFTLTSGNSEEELEIPDMEAFHPESLFVTPEGWCENMELEFERIRGIVLRNAVDGGLDPLVNLQNEESGNPETACAGLWALPSFINHSCVPNCLMMDVGNAMFVRASRKLAAGEELTRSYFNVFQSVDQRQEAAGEWHFVCSCERCLMEKDLTFRQVLPSVDYCKLLEMVEEEANKKRLHESKGVAFFLLPSPQPALRGLRDFGDWIDKKIASLENLQDRQRAWIGASFVKAYIARLSKIQDKMELITALEALLEMMTNTAIVGIGSSENPLEKAVVLLDEVGQKLGRSSKSYRRIEKRVFSLYRAAYGYLDCDVLSTIIRKMVRQPSA